MKVIVLKDYEAVSEFSFQKLSEKLHENIGKKIVLGLPTGSTPLLFYKKISENELDFENVITFNMDEYVGLDKQNENSFYYFMNQNLYSKVNLKEQNINIPNGMAKDLTKECMDYEEKIKQAGGIDMFFGGVGSNGHIAFNEPYSSFNSVTRVQDLTLKTIKDNSRFFKSLEEVPKKALTVGISTIMSAKELIFMASGENKARAVFEAVKGEVSEACPVTVLQKHENAYLVVDEAAASLLK